MVTGSTAATAAGAITAAADRCACGTCAAAATACAAGSMIPVIPVGTGIIGPVAAAAAVALAAAGTRSRVDCHTCSRINSTVCGSVAAFCARFAWIAVGIVIEIASAFIVVGILAAVAAVASVASNGCRTAAGAAAAVTAGTTFKMPGAVELQIRVAAVLAVCRVAAAAAGRVECARTGEDQRCIRRNKDGRLAAVGPCAAVRRGAVAAGHGQGRAGRDVDHDRGAVCDHKAVLVVTTGNRCVCEDGINFAVFQRAARCREFQQIGCFAFRACSRCNEDPGAHKHEKAHEQRKGFARCRMICFHGWFPPFFEMI